MSEPLVHLNGESAVPPFEQIRAQLAARIGAGRLVAGTKLPTVRALAEQLGVAVNTAARAYRELESAGLIETRGRTGTMVSARGDRGRERLQAAALRFAELARDVGIDDDEALEIARAAIGGDR